ncbi:hypothetical protein [Azospirillum himalayense]|uniref:DUF1376 domain-containing protein n=1 Tax=Azospirillum himalayense TaxID=654847 RepID=A0ABW0GDF5_9PROT
MARIRTIKPEFCTSEQVAECSPTARLLFILMWPFCDDRGVHPDSAKRLKMQCFPADDFTAAAIEGLLNELVAQGLLRRFEVDGQRFLHVTGWEKHQKIDKPNYKWPAPPTSNSANSTSGAREEVDHSANVQDQSATGRRTVADSSPPEGSGVERSGEERKPPPLSPSDRGNLPAEPAMVVVKAFMAARNERWPEAMPATITSTQAEHVKVLLAEPGATVDLVCDLVRHGVAGWNGPEPPGGVGALRQSVRNRIAQHKRAQEGGGASKSSGSSSSGPRSVDPHAQERGWLRRFVKNGRWEPEWGPKLGHQMNRIPHRIIVEELGAERAAEFGIVIEKEDA